MYYICAAQSCHCIGHIAKPLVLWLGVVDHFEACEVHLKKPAGWQISPQIRAPKTPKTGKLSPVAFETLISQKNNFRQQKHHRDSFTPAWKPKPPFQEKTHNYEKKTAHTHTHIIPETKNMERIEGAYFITEHRHGTRVPKLFHVDMLVSCCDFEFSAPHESTFCRKPNHDKPRSSAVLQCNNL